MKYKLNNIFIFFLISVIIQCEKDDICLVETQGTPRVILRLFDKENQQVYKSASNITIIGLNKDNPLKVLNSDSIAIPLRTNYNFTRYIFSKNIGDSIYKDTIQFNHTRVDKYMNRSCGFKSEFLIDSNLIEMISGDLNWIYNFKILNKKVSNETKAHVAIYH